MAKLKLQATAATILVLEPAVYLLNNCGLVINFQDTSPMVLGLPIMAAEIVPTHSPLSFLKSFISRKL